jgi:hypothetical protein
MNGGSPKGITRVATVTHLPPSENDWTWWERSQFDRLLLELDSLGIEATRYEWFAGKELCCCVRRRSAGTIAEVARSNRSYVVRLHNGVTRTTFDLAVALRLVVSQYSLQLSRGGSSNQAS